MKSFGLIGKSLTHSFSATHFKRKFSKENHSGYRYDLFPLSDISQITHLINEHESLAGLNITNPYKQAVMPFLHQVDDVAAAVGAVNTVKIYRTPAGAVLKGFNTDVSGFERSFPQLADFDNALVLGAGGAACAVSYVLKKRQIDYLMVSRTPGGRDQIAYEQVNEKVLKRFRLIINATPLGMYPETGHLPPIPYDHLTGRHFLYDLIYNPPETRFLLEGRQRGAKTMNGGTMLTMQAEAAWDIWQDDAL
jgi:shikimate dehydrogenase